MMRPHTARALLVCALVTICADWASAATITIAWDSSQSAVAGYLVHIGTSPGSYSQTQDVGQATSFSFADAAAGQRYYFAVSAYDAQRVYSTRSSEISGIGPGVSVGVGSGGVSVGVGGSDVNIGGSTPVPTSPATQIRLAWDASPSGGVAGYLVHIGPSSGNYTQTEDVGGATSFVLDGAAPGQRYYFAVSAYDPSRTPSGRSNEVSGTTSGTSSPGTGSGSTPAPAPAPTPEPAPPPPSGNSGGSTGGTGSGGNGTASPAQITLAWDRSPSANVAGYTVHVGTTSGSYSNSIDVGTQTSFSFGQAEAGQRYFFAVNAYAPGPVAGGLSGEVSSLTAIETNPAPTITNPGEQETFVGDWVSLQIAAADPNGGRLSFSATGLPPGVQIDSATGRLTGRPTTTGLSLVAVSVNDGASTATQIFTWLIRSRGGSGIPDVNIINPTEDQRYTTRDAFITLSGEAFDDGDLIDVRWTNSRGGAGLTSGSDWWIATIPLRFGWNLLTVTGRDAAGNSGSSLVWVERRR